jgi:small subunit ribosomal protein S8
MHQDKVSDYLTRLRNALMVYSADVVVPHTKLLESLTVVLQRDGYLARYEVVGSTPAEKKIRIYLKYDRSGKSIIRKLSRMSRPGLRKYFSAKNIPLIMSGSGVVVLSTNQGLLTDRQARAANVGGEPLCLIY